MARTRLAPVAHVVVASLLAGCGVRTGGTIATVSATSIAPQWPPRIGAPVAVHLSEATEGVRLVLRHTGPTGQLFELEHPQAADASAVVSVPVIGASLAIEWTGLGADARARLTDRSFLYAAPDEEAIIAREQGGRKRQLKLTFRFPRIRPLKAQEPADLAPRGTCVILPSIVGATSVERQLMPLVDKGWTVVAFELDDFARATRVGTKTRIRERDAEELGRILADELADSAYAVELLLRQLVEEDPRRSTAPLVLVGASLGAIELPSCAAYLARSEAPLPRLEGAVLLAGGVGIDAIMLDGSLGRDWLRELGATLPADRDDPAWREAFARSCSLSPERCLYALDGIPVLLIDGRFDDIVPRATADRLWEALGRPARWSYPLGHIGLFLFLGNGTWTEAREWIDSRGRRPIDPAEPQARLERRRDRRLPSTPASGT